MVFLRQFAKKIVESLVESSEIKSTLTLTVYKLCFLTFFWTNHSYFSNFKAIQAWPFIGGIISVFVSIRIFVALINHI